MIGYSGGGKTVLARCIVGLEKFDAGTVEVDGVVIGPQLGPDDPSWVPVRIKVGLVAQNRALPPYRTVIDLIAEGPRFVLGLTRHDAHSRSISWLERLGLERHTHKYPHELSGGQLARVCLARALVMEPSYLICDEVTAQLDPLMAAEVATSLLDVVKLGVGVLLISHQIEFLRRYASRVEFLDHGHIVASGFATDMLDAPTNERVRAFLQGIALGR